LHRAIDILDCFSERRTELSIMEIVEKTGLDRSTARRLALTLARRGLLKKTSTGRYQLGLHLFELGNVVPFSFSLRRAAVAQLAALETQVNGTILLAAREGEYFVILDKRETVSDGLSMVPMPSRVGVARPLTFGAIGRVLMSTLPTAAAIDLIAKHPLQANTPYSITDVEVFLGALRRVKERGYEMEVNEVTEGILSFAVPVLDFSGQTVGALCIGLPATRENDAALLESTLARLMEASVAVSANMGYRE
jgi:DNA-binding IclR family transcriptional regulator